jgi:dipeptidase
MKYLSFLMLAIISVSLNAQEKCDWEAGVPEGCTTITVGKKASTDGSVFTSHTDDSHRTRSWMDIVPAKMHAKGSTVTMYKRESCDSLVMPTYKHTPIGAIPQVASTYKYINTAYPAMNEKQLGIGESTFGGRDTLQSNNGLIDCQRLVQLMLERCTTAREAIDLADELTAKYGWNDYGECLTIADPKEVWHFEIVGPGKGKTGAVWVAQRVPDDHIAVNANASTIKTIDLSKPDYYRASKNVYQVAEDLGFYNPKTDVFSFAHIYAPHSRASMAARRREWRVYDLLAPSLKLDPYASDFPFSVKPDTLVSFSDLAWVFKDYYEGTDFDMTKNLTVADKNGQQIISPLANPFMSYDANKLHRINGGWGWLGERTIARWYTMYGTIIQLRDWLPDEVGGVTWLAMDNMATSIYIPVYAGSNDLPASYKVPGRPNGYTMASAWWAFNRMSTLASQRWGEARYDVDKVFGPLQTELINNQAAFEKEVLNNKSKKQQEEQLTKYTLEWGERVVKEAWKLGDLLWTKYEEKF